MCEICDISSGELEMHFASIWIMLHSQFPIGADRGKGDLKSGV